MGIIRFLGKLMAVILKGLGALMLVLLFLEIAGVTVSRLRKTGERRRETSPTHRPSARPREIRSWQNSGGSMYCCRLKNTDGERDFHSD